MASKDQENRRKEFGDKLRKIRERPALTQADIATAADINANYYSRIERSEGNRLFEKL